MTTKEPSPSSFTPALGRNPGSYVVTAFETEWSITVVTPKGL